MTILSILNEIAATASTKEKEAIIRREKNNELLKLVFQAAYNTFITYGIKAIPAYVASGSDDLVYSIAAINEHLATRLYTGNAATKFLLGLLEELSADDAIVLERIIGRDLRCGASDTIAAKIWPGLVPTFDVMLSHKDISGIKFPAYAQIKSDGARCHMSLQAGRGVAFSRNGKPIELHGTFDAALMQTIKEGETLDGELLAIGADGKILDRKTGNGMINTLVKYNDVVSKLEEEICQLEKKLEILK
jgi:hypothetical protein